MEFLVRVKDKIRPLVFCLNPIHKGEHMDRVSFEDATFEAPCPACGNDEWLFRKNNVTSKKGHFITFKDDDWGWGTNELKHFGIARIDCTYEQAKEWCEAIENELARTDAKYYRNLARERRVVVILNVKTGMSPPITKEKLRKAIKEALKSDHDYLILIEGERLAENRANIDHRFRKMFFDFEKVLTDHQLKSWNNMDEESDIVTVYEGNKFQIKEI